MGNDLDLVKKANISAIAKKGSKIYKKIKGNYDPKYHGQYLAIEVKSGDIFLGKDGVEAMEKAEKKYPDTVFYLQKIGFDTAERIFQSWSGTTLHG